MKEETIELKCPNCDYLMKKVNISDIGEKEELELICKKCKHPISVKLSKKKRFSCDKCGKEFDSRQEVEKHEKKCKKERQTFQFFCPYCNSELSWSFNPLGERGEMTCNKCNKRFRYAFGKITHAVGFTGYNAKQGFLRMIINGQEEEINWYATRGIDLKRNDLILIIWKKRLFNQDKPHQILNYTTGVRNQL